MRIKNTLKNFGLKGFLPFYLFTFLPLNAQVGTWKNYLAYNHVEQIYASGDHIFVRASNGLYLYNKKDLSITTFDKVNGLSDTNIKLIGWSNQAKRLIAVYQNSNIDLIETNGNITNISSLYSKTMTEDKTVNNVYVNGIYAYLSTGFGIVKVNMQKAEITETYHLRKNITATSIKNNTIYAKIDDTKVISASTASNLLDPGNWSTTDEYPYDTFIFDQKDWETYYDLISTLNPGGPKYNYFAFMKYLNDRLYTSGGGTTSTHIPPAIQVLKDNEWEIYQDAGIMEITGINPLNMNCVDVDPNDPEHVFAGARSGLYEFKNGQFVRLYNHTNSPIEPFDGKSKDYELIQGLKFDQSGNLWILNCQAPTQSLIEYTKDGEFISHKTPELMKLQDKSLGNLRNAIFDSNNYLWFVNNHWVVPSAYRYDTQNHQIISYTDFVNQDGLKLLIGDVECIAEDRDGNMWIGTNGGPLLLEKSQIESNNPIFKQVKVPRNDGTDYADYLLNKIDITAICIDAGNRKWMGTKGNGVYLIGSDNITQLQHFTIDNSELLSNNIQSIAINNKTGEVFFGTDNGLCSFVSDATTINEEMTKDNVWAYPNPVTPDYTGLITIVGLTYNADVKIISSNGILIAEGRSNGGTFTWNGKDKNGNRVASGIYMVVTATSDSKKGTVCKIAFIK